MAISTAVTDQAGPLKVFLISCVYIFIAGCVIFLNKHLMHKSRFPQPLALVTLHMGSNFLFCLIIKLILPSFFPLWENVTRNWMGTLIRILPISVLCCASFVLSNAAYIYVSVALLQIITEVNMVLVYLGSLLMGMILFKWRFAFVIFCIFAFTVGATAGDVSFVWIGVLMKIACQFFDAAKILFMNKYLSGQSEWKFDQLSFLLIMTPAAFLILASVQAVMWKSIILKQAGEVWGLLVVNCFLVFGLNVIVTTFLKISSGVTLVVVGVSKDILIVVVSAIIFHDKLLPHQIVCFSIAMLFIGLYSMMKLYSDQFDIGFRNGFREMVHDAKTQLGVIPKEEEPEKISLLEERSEEKNNV